MNGPLDHDPFVIAVVLAIATALASIEDSSLGSLSLTLVALAVATRLVHLRSPARGVRLPREELTGLSIVALAALLYVVAPASIDPVRGPIFAASLLPLWWATRHPAPDRRVLG
ncbi:MAG: hypothetical protein WAN74_08255 [Thermoplasmata archaeon]